MVSTTIPFGFALSSVYGSRVSKTTPTPMRLDEALIQRLAIATAKMSNTRTGVVGYLQILSMISQCLKICCRWPAVLLVWHALGSAGLLFAAERGTPSTSTHRPASFPHRIWAACDFEWTAPDYGWFGIAETNRIPAYPGNRTALRATPGPYEKVSAIMAGINPVPGPRMGKENGLFVRYFLKGGAKAVFQHFSLTREDNWHIVVDDLKTNQWSELALNFTRDAKRNDGSAERFGEGERMDDFKVIAGSPTQAANYELLLDDVIFFANDPSLPPEPEPFPNRVILLAAFDTGPKHPYWPGDYTIAETPPEGAFWRTARSVPRRDGPQMVVLPITPPRPVGAHTKLRFRFHLTGASSLTVQIFDATVQDNRHIRLNDLKQGRWTSLYLDFSRNSRRNDGTPNSPFTAGNLVDDLFFFVEGEGAKTATLHVDEVVLFDAGIAKP